MGKYSSIQTSVFSVFGSDTWKAEKIKTIPINFLGLDLGNEYIRVAIIASGTGINTKSGSGIISVEIFTPAGNGPTSGTHLADKLDSYLQGKTIPVDSSTVVQCGISAMTPSGMDSDNPTLYKSIYQIPFNLFGAF